MSFHLNLGRTIAARSLTIGLALFFVLMLGLVSCKSVAKVATTPPHLLGVVQMHEGDALTGQGVVAPNGLFYVINEGGSVAVLDGPRMVAHITFTVPSDYRTNLYNWMRRPSLTAIGVQTQTGLLYVTDDFLNVVHVISGTTVVTDMTNVGVHPMLVAVHSKTGLIYVASDFLPQTTVYASNIAVISGTQIITHIMLDGIPQSLLINPVDNQVYIGHTPTAANINKEAGGMMTVISGTQLLTNTLSLREGGGFQAIAADQRTGGMYMFQGSILVYWDGKDVVKRLGFGIRDYTLIGGLAVDARRGWAYVCAAQGHVFVVKQDLIIADLPTELGSIAAVMDETHDFVYVANHKRHSMSVIRGTEVITTLNTEGAGPRSITIDEKRGYIYVSNGDMGGSVSVFGFDSPIADKPSFWHTFLAWLGR